MTYVEFVNAVRAEFPSFKIVNKSDSFFMRTLSLLLLVVTFGQQSEFMTAFITTIGYTVYVPDSWMDGADEGRISVLRHERVHMRQRRKYSMPLFTFLYLVPFFPLGLAYFRAKFEWEAYEETMRVAVEYHGKVILKLPIFKENILSHFTTGQYGWMWPFRKTLERWYAASVTKLAP